MSAQVAASGGKKLWWAREWETLIRRSFPRGYVSEGRALYRAGAVETLTVTAGEIAGEIRGSQNEPFTTRCGYPLLGDDEAEEIRDVLTANPALMVPLVTGSMPLEIAEVLLRDRAIDLSCTCTCPIAVGPCKHGAALAWAAHDTLERAPLELLKFRGLSLAALSAQGFDDEGAGAEGFIGTGVGAGAAEVTEGEVPAARDAFFAGAEMPQVRAHAGDFRPAYLDADISVLRQAIRGAGYSAVDELAVIADVEVLFERLRR